MTSRMLGPALIAVALVHAINAIIEGRIFEGVLLVVLGLAGGLYVEYLFAKLQEKPRRV
ncbi:MAG: hypothetical protein QXN23_01685 [Candidatus Caldarchaeum sp.]